MTTAEEPVVAPRMRVHRATELLRELITANEAFVGHMGRELSVNDTDLSAMSHLIAGGPLGPTELSKRLQLSTAAVTTVVDRLESAGHVHRAQHPSDRRAVVIVPSPASVQQAMGVLIPMITGVDGVISEFPDDQRDVISAYLERVVEVYKAQVPSDA